MSTTILTTITVYTLIGGLNVALLEALDRRQLVKASLFAAAMSAVIHLAFVMSAWKEAAEEVPYPGASSLPTAVYDAPAWAAVVFLTTGIILAVIQRRRQKALKKKLLEALVRSFGVNEGDESEKD